MHCSMIALSICTKDIVPLCGCSFCSTHFNSDPYDAIFISGWDKYVFFHLPPIEFMTNVIGDPYDVVSRGGLVILSVARNFKEKEPVIPPRSFGLIRTPQGHHVGIFALLHRASIGTVLTSWIFFLLFWSWHSNVKGLKPAGWSLGFFKFLS